jgi:hypothetical protein
MSMDGDYQSKDVRYDSINKKMIASIVLIAIAFIGLWYLYSAY